MTDTTWTDGTPAEVRRAVDPIAKRWACVLPTSLHSLTFRFDSDNEAENAAATCITQSEYHQATIGICGAWLEETPSDRERKIVHEYAHILLAPMAEFVDEILKELDPTAQRFVLRQWEKSVETVVCDLAESLIRARAKR